ncbi:MAG: hypothetical protein WA159_15630, partial [Variovorax sp.]
GLADLIVGAHNSDPAGGAEAGRSYVVFGKTSGEAVNLSALTVGSSTAGFVISGQAASDYSGRSVSSAGDVNGDGLADLIVGAYGADTTAGADAGNAYVVFGKTSGEAVDLSSLTSGLSSAGFALFGGTASSSAGSSVAAAGDLNGDGFDDLLIGAPGSGAGNAYVVFGGQFLNPGVNAILGATGTQNTLTGTTGADTLVGRALNDTLTGGGGVDVFYGGAGNDVMLLNNSNIAALTQSGALVDGGSGIDTLRLVNTANVVVSLDLRNIGNTKLSSIERIDITGTANNTLTLALSDLRALQDATGQSGFNAFSSLGGVAANTGRQQVMIDGNSGDVLKLAMSATLVGSVTSGGVSYNVYNAYGAQVQLLVAANVSTQFITPAPVDLSTIAATNYSGSLGFVINGQAAGDESGWSVSSAGDVNGDGLADLIVSADASDPAGGTNAGRSYVVFGKTSGEAVNLSALTAGSSTAGFVINGQAASDISGYSVSGAGDVNGDGLADLIVGAYGSDPAGGDLAGRSYVVFGKTSGAAINLSALTATTTAGFVINGQAA